MIAGMAVTLGPVLLKLGDQAILAFHEGTKVTVLLQQLNKLCPGCLIADHDGFDINSDYPKDLPGGEYRVTWLAAAGKSAVVALHSRQ